MATPSVDPPPLVRRRLETLALDPAIPAEEANHGTAPGE